MATLGTSRLLLGCGLILELVLSGCSKHETKTPGTMAGTSTAGEAGHAGNAGAGTNGGAGSSGAMSGTSGGMGASCDERGCGRRATHQRSRTEHALGEVLHPAATSARLRRRRRRQ